MSSLLANDQWFSNVNKILAYCVLQVHFNSADVFLILFLQPSSTAVKNRWVKEIRNLMWSQFDEVKGE